MSTIITSGTYIQRLITTGKKATSNSFKITFKRQDRVSQYQSHPSCLATILIVNLLMLIIHGKVDSVFLLIQLIR